MNETVLVSFIIPCLNSELSLGTTLDSIFRQNTGKFEVIVVDNGSTDRTAQIAEKYSVTLLKCTIKGPAAARNMGARFASGKFLAFIDSDVVLEDNWLSVMLTQFSRGVFAAGVGRIIPAGPESFLNNYRTKLNNLRYLGTNLSLRSSSGVGPVINTAACMYHRTIFLASGGFSEDLLRFEDTALSTRLYFSGGMLFGTMDARAHVYFHGSLWSYLKRSFELGQWKLPLGRYSGLSLREIIYSQRREILGYENCRFNGKEWCFHFLNKLFLSFGFAKSLIFRSTVKIEDPRSPFSAKLKRLSFLQSPAKTIHAGSGCRVIVIDNKLYLLNLKSSYKSVLEISYHPTEEEIRILSSEGFEVRDK